MEMQPDHCICLCWRPVPTKPSLAQNPVAVKRVRSEHLKQVRESVASSNDANLSFVQLKQTLNFQEATYGLLLLVYFGVQQPPQLWFLCWLRLEEHYEAIKCFARFVYSWHLLPVAGAHFSQTHGCQKGLNKICQSKLQGVVHRKRKQFKQLAISAGPARVGILLRRAVKRWYVWLIWCASC